MRYDIIYNVFLAQLKTPVILLKKMFKLSNIAGVL